MAQPTPYTRQYNFTSYQTSNPSTPLPGNQVDAELNAVKAATDAIDANLKLIQRDDGAIANGSVTADSLGTTALTLLGTTAGTPRGAWVTVTAYAVRDLVTQTGVTYICVAAHTSGVFATDLANKDWMVLQAAQSAASITNAPTAPLVSTDVQSVVNELQTNITTEATSRASADTTHAALTSGTHGITAAGAALNVGATAAAQRTTLGLGTMALQNVAGLTLAENRARGAAVASANSCDIWTPADGNLLHITGTTQINNFAAAPQQGAERVVIFDGILTLKNNANILLPGSADIVTAIGDFAYIVADTATATVRIAYYRANGQALVQLARFTSTAQAITLGTLIGPIAHGLGVVPFSVTSDLKCVTSEGGFTGGTDVIQSWCANGMNDGANARGLSTYADATNISARISNANPTIAGIILGRKDTGAAFTLTPANWNIILKAQA